MAFTIKNLKIRDQILLVTLPPLFVLLCAVALFFYAYWSGIHTQRTAIPTMESVVRGESFLRHTTEAAMAVRSYALTHHDDTLAPYDKAVTEALSDIMALGNLEDADSAQLQDINRIRAEFDQFE